MLLRERLKKPKKVVERKPPQLAQTCYKGADNNTEKDVQDNIILACTLFLVDKDKLGHNQCLRGKALFKGCLDLDSLDYREFCPEPYPSICICGKFLSDEGCAILTSCYYCEAKSPWYPLNWAMQILSSKLLIHDSWIKYGFAEALYIERHKRIKATDKRLKVFTRRN